MSIGNLIRQSRKAAGLTQVELASLMSVNKSAVAQWELDHTRPTEENMAALKRLLGIQAGPQPSPGAPYRGKLVEDPELIAWLEFLEPIPSAERRVLAKHIMGSLVMPKAKEA